MKKSIFIILLIALATLAYAREQQNFFASWTYQGKCTAVRKDILFNGCTYSLTKSQNKRWTCLDISTLQCSGLGCPDKTCGVKSSTKAILTGFMAQRSKTPLTGYQAAQKEAYDYTYLGGCVEGNPTCHGRDGNGWICISRTTLQCTGAHCPETACGARKTGSHITAYQIKPTFLMGKTTCVGAPSGKYYGANCQTEGLTLYFRMLKDNRLETCKLPASGECNTQWRCATASMLSCLGSACPETVCGIRRK